MPDRAIPLHQNRPGFRVAKQHEHRRRQLEADGLCVRFMIDPRRDLQPGRFDCLDEAALRLGSWMWAIDDDQAGRLLGWKGKRARAPAGLPFR
jgi:hypothetical protein